MADKSDNWDLTAALIKQYGILISGSLISVLGLLFLPWPAALLVCACHYLVMYLLFWRRPKLLSEQIVVDDRRWIGLILRSAGADFRDGDAAILADRCEKLARRIAPNGDEPVLTFGLGRVGRILDAASGEMVDVTCASCGAEGQVLAGQIPPGVNLPSMLSICPRCVARN